MRDSSIAGQAKLIQDIQRGGSSRKTAITEIYNSLDLAEPIRRSITKTSTEQMIHYDVLHEAFYIFLKKVKENAFDPNTPIKPFLMKTAKFLWLNMQKKSPKEFTSDELHDVQITDSVEEYHIQKELSEHMKRVFYKLTESCQDIMKLWILNYSYEEIAKKLNLKNKEYVRKRRYTCYQSLLEFIRQTPELKDYNYG